MTKPRLVHIITRLIAGGAQENTVLSCRALKDRYDTTLVTGPPEGVEGSLVETARAAGIVRRPPDGLDQRRVAAQETLFVRVQYDHQRHLRQVQPLSQ